MNFSVQSVIQIRARFICFQWKQIYKKINKFKTSVLMQYSTHLKYIKITPDYVESLIKSI